ncbi:hypothetical protein H7R52_05620 [Weissella confusa]|uniref:ATP-grasp domain-containing protein n=1 Tax=Weissella confusa TaxID=1583 RepID=A0A923NFB8_WEICO|nr:hypothetical protein [Weissella confusa]
MTSLALARRFDDLGFQLVATAGTGAFFAQNGLRVDVLDKISETDNNAVTAMRDDKLQIVVNTTRQDGTQAPIFSFTKLPDVDSLLGPEMKSTGEVMGSDSTFEKALYKAFVASNVKVPTFGNVLFTVADEDKGEYVQFVIHEDTAYVIEVNPRASRTVPFISKVTHLKLAQLATRVMLGERLADMGFETGVIPEPKTVHV